jgi:signal peptidase II
LRVRPIVWLIAVAVVLVDQLTKQWALANLQEGIQKPIWGEYLSLELVFNDGAAFSFGSGYTWVLTLIAVAVTGGIVYYSRRAQTTFAAVLFGIGLGGAVGNLIDRLFRAPGFGQGHVVDMINYNNWFVGNVADIAIVGAALVFVIMGIAGKRILEPLPADAAAGDAPAAEGETEPPGDQAAGRG